MAEGVSSVVAIAAGADTSIALTADGSVYTWGWRRKHRNKSS